MYKNSRLKILKLTTKYETTYVLIRTSLRWVQLCSYLNDFLPSLIGESHYLTKKTFVDAGTLEIYFILKD